MRHDMTFGAGGGSVSSAPSAIVSQSGGHVGRASVVVIGCKQPSAGVIQTTSDALQNQQQQLQVSFPPNICHFLHLNPVHE